MSRKIAIAIVLISVAYAFLLALFTPYANYLIKIPEWWRPTFGQSNLSALTWLHLISALFVFACALPISALIRFATKKSSRPKAYAECRGHRRDAFVLELFRQIEAKLDQSDSDSKAIPSMHADLDLRLFELAAEAYRRRGTPKFFLDSQTLTQAQKAELYDKVVMSERGRPAKNNPYKS